MQRQEPINNVSEAEQAQRNQPEKKTKVVGFVQDTVDIPSDANANATRFEQATRTGLQPACSNDTMVLEHNESNLSVADVINMGAAYQLQAEKLFQIYKVEPERGLEPREVVMRQKRFGKNTLSQQDSHILEETAQLSVGGLFVKQFKDTTMAILGIAILHSFVSKQYKDLAMICLVMLTHALIGFSQEYKWRSAVKTCNELAAAECEVVRAGDVISLKASQLVPGDIVLLKGKTQVPADIRLFYAEALCVNEKIFTGRDGDTHKLVDPLDCDNLPIGERKNMVFMGTKIRSGTAKGIVVSVGGYTHMGHKAALVLHHPWESAMERSRSPLYRYFKNIGRKLVEVSLILLVYIIVLGSINNVNLPEITKEANQQMIKEELYLGINLLMKIVSSLFIVLLATFSRNLLIARRSNIPITAELLVPPFPITPTTNSESEKERSFIPVQKNEPPKIKSDLIPSDNTFEGVKSCNDVSILDEAQVIELPDLADKPATTEQHEEMYKLLPQQLADNNVIQLPQIASDTRSTRNEPSEVPDYLVKLREQEPCKEVELYRLKVAQLDNRRGSVPMPTKHRWDRRASLSKAAMRISELVEREQIEHLPHFHMKDLSQNFQQGYHYNKSEMLAILENMENIEMPQSLKILMDDCDAVLPQPLLVPEITKPLPSDGIEQQYGSRQVYVEATVTPQDISVDIEPVVEKRKKPYDRFRTEHAPRNRDRKNRKGKAKDIHGESSDSSNRKWDDFQHQMAIPLHEDENKEKDQNESLVANELSFRKSIPRRSIITTKYQHVPEVNQAKSRGERRKIIGDYF